MNEGPTAAQVDYLRASPDKVGDIPPGTPHCVWVFVTEEVEGGYVPSVVYENVSGHFPLSGRGEGSSPWVWGPTFADAERIVDQANERLGIGRVRALEIVMSSFAAHNREKRRS